MTREYLSNYIYLEQEIERIKRKIKEWEAKIPAKECSVVQESSKSFPYRKRTYTVSGFNIEQQMEKASKIRELNEKLKQKKEELEDMKLNIELFITDIEDHRTHLIFTYRYIDGMKEEEIGDKIFLTKSGVSKIISRFLEKQ